MLISSADRENFYSVQYMNVTVWPLLTFFISLHNQLSSMHSIITYYRVPIFEKNIHWFGSKNEWLLLSAGSTLLHENFAVSRSSSKNREIKMLRKMHFELNREIKMHQKIRFFDKKKKLSWNENIGFYTVESFFLYFSNYYM